MRTNWLILLCALFVGLSSGFLIGVRGSGCAAMVQHILGLEAQQLEELRQLNERSMQDHPR